MGLPPTTRCTPAGLALGYEQPLEVQRAWEPLHVFPDDDE
jgi:hypothetical protein